MFKNPLEFGWWYIGKKSKPRAWAEVYPSAPVLPRAAVAPVTPTTCAVNPPSGTVPIVSPFPVGPPVKPGAKPFGYRSTLVPAIELFALRSCVVPNVYGV